MAAAAMEKYFFKSDGRSFYYTPVESARRRRAAFCINSDGVLEVLVPLGFGRERVEGLCRDHLAVIDKLFLRFHAVADRIRHYRFEEGEEFYLFGRSFPLRFTQRLCRFSGEAFLVPQGDAAAIQASLARIYRKALRELLEQHTIQLAASVGKNITAVRISSARRRWGSCSSAGVISFSWRLAQCPPELIEYVLWHELSHLDEMSHSARFYRILAGYLPDHAARRRDLQKFSCRII